LPNKLPNYNNLCFGLFLPRLECRNKHKQKQRFGPLPNRAVENPAPGLKPLSSDAADAAGKQPLENNMKALIATLPLTALLCTTAIAAPVKGQDDVMLSSVQIDGYKAIPAVGDMTGKVISVYAGSAHALEHYVVTVNNTAAPCEGDDCMASKTFELNGYEGQYVGEAAAVYSRRIDKDTYSIAIKGKVLDHEGEDERGFPAAVPAKILLRVKFTKDGVAEIADVSSSQWE
jgi:hypothetical protein